ncbi:MAG: hypothetical protein IKP76_04445 [Bacilli bacterium]|nr:hypothetical protein [Bacilli bacterium]
MKKKTVIIISTLLFTLIMGLIFAWRIYLITQDTTGIYLLPTEDFLSFFLNYLPVLTIVITVITTYARRKMGLVFSVIASIMSVLSLVVELVIFICRSLDFNAPVPKACLPWLDIPIIIICVILFIIKFKIYTLPKTIKFK